MATDRHKPTSEEEQWIDAITRMIELTHSKELEWELGDSPAPGRGDPTTPPYHTDYKGRTYRLQGRWVEARPNFFIPRDFAPRDKEAITLDMVDARGRSLYRVPSVSPLRDLLNAVQRQTADPNAAIRDLLSDRGGGYEKPLNQMLLELNEKIPDAIFSNNNTGEDLLIKDMRAELENNPQGGPMVVAEADDRGVWSLTTLEEGYSAGFVGSVFEDTGEGEPS